jgi:hypothetical protein
MIKLAYSDVDDQTTAYILATQTYFEDLKQVAAQLAGLLVLSASGAKSATPDHSMLSSAEQLYKNATDGLKSVRATPRARRHHESLQTALAKLGEALSSAKGTGDPLIPLESAYADLRSASRTLPGFEMVSFQHCCCHAK